MAITSAHGSSLSSWLRSLSNSSRSSPPDRRLRLRLPRHTVRERGLVLGDRFSAQLQGLETIGHAFDGTTDSLEVILEFAGAGDIRESEANAGELASEKLGIGLSALGDAP